MDDEFPPGRGDRKPVSWNRIVIWVIGAAVGAYLVLSGIFGIVAKG
jgi:hypothetical protein